MLNILGFWKHGEIRTNTISVNQGKQIINRREKFCANCGWKDIFPIGGESGWEKLHANCDNAEYLDSRQTTNQLRQAA